VLFDVRDRHAGERRDLFRLPRHRHVASDDVDVKGSPARSSHKRGHGKTDTGSSIDRWPRSADLETKPVANVVRGGDPQLILGDVLAGVTVHVDVNRAADSDVASEQRRCALHDPTLVLEIQPFQ